VGRISEKCGRTAPGRLSAAIWPVTLAVIAAITAFAAGCGGKSSSGGIAAAAAAARAELALVDRDAGNPDSANIAASSAAWKINIEAERAAPEYAGPKPDVAWYIDNPKADTFTISTADELAGLAFIVWVVRDDFEGKTVRLVNNIDLAAYKNWVPIGIDFNYESSFACSFSGTFDGGGYVVSNLTINRPKLSVQGLFGGIRGGTVKNLGVEGVDIQGGITVGGLAGKISGGSRVEFCYSTGVVRASGGGPNRMTDNVGGLVGYVGDTSSIANCYSTAAVSGVYSGIGGIAGDVTKRSSVINSYYAGTVSGGDHAGGVVGRLAGDSFVENSYSAGLITGIDNVGGVVGGVSGGSDVRNSYSAATVRGDDNVGGIVGFIHWCEHKPCPSVIANCAALNPEVSMTGTGGSDDVGRVSGNVRAHHNRDTLSNNVAYAGMINVSGNTVWPNIGANTANGMSITSAAVLADGTIGGRFTKKNGWTVENGKLPGLNGPAVSAPHLQIYLRHSRLAARAGRGGTRRFAVGVFGGGRNKSVIWSVSGNASGSTAIDASGLLTVAADETASALTVTAAAAVDTAVSASVSVTVTPLSDTRWYTDAVAADPRAAVFTISTAGELAGLAEIVNGMWDGKPARYSFSGKTIKLAADIDLSEYDNWMPIGEFDQENWEGGIPFSGTFEGGGHVISNLRVSKSNSDGAGLFALVRRGVVRNLGLVDVDVQGRGNVGALAGFVIDRSRIANCYSTGRVSGDSFFHWSRSDGTGGVVGHVSGNSSVASCYSAAVVSGSNYAGGVVGAASVRSRVANCFSAGPVRAGGQSVGGVLGYSVNESVGANNVRVSAEEINADGTIGGRFTNDNGWTTENGKLPGLRGKTVEMPEHLRQILDCR